MKEYQIKVKAEWEGREVANEGRQELGVAAHTCDPSTQEAKTGGSQVLEHRGPLTQNMRKGN